VPSINDNAKPAEGEMKRRPRRRPSNGGKGYGGAAKA
jgi:ATP-dependent RNA helicase RhlE